MKTIAIFAALLVAFAAPALADSKSNPPPPDASEREDMIDTAACVKELGFTQVWTKQELIAGKYKKVFLVWSDGKVTTTPQLNAEQREKCGQ